MVFTCHYALIEKGENEYDVESHDTPCCPDCGEALVYRDTCRRFGLLEGRKRKTYHVRRLKCRKCNKIHRELPDCVAPYKQYETEPISGVLDGIITSDDEDSEDYPCESTIERWIRWLLFNLLLIEGYLESVSCQELGIPEEQLRPEKSRLTLLREVHPNWLEIIIRSIYNSGGYLVPV